MGSPEGLVVLGAGLAGLAASLETQAPCYEAADCPGGVASSDRSEGFTFDRGIHILQTQSEPVLRLLSDLGVELVRHERNAHIYSHETYTAYPFQINTAGLPIGLRARCVWNFMRRGQHPSPANYEEWIYRSLGNGFADTFLIPYSEKFWRVHPREMTHDWMGNRVPQPTSRQVFRGAVWSKQTEIGTNASFSYPRTGYGDIGRALARRAGQLHLRHRATQLDVKAQRIEFNGEHEVDYRVLISSIPLPELVRIARDAPSGVRSAAEKLRTNSIMVVNLGVGRANISDRNWVHFPEKDISFFRISFPATFSPEVVPPGTSSISAEVAYSNSDPIDRDRVVDRVIDDLVRVGALRADDPIIARTTQDVRWGYCIYDHDRAEAIRVLRNWLRSVNVIPTGRYGLWTYYWSDQAILSGFKAAAQARAFLESPEPRVLEYAEDSV